MLVRTLDQRATPGNALDIGCGAGTYSLYMAGRGYTVTAIDFMPQAVEMTRRRAAEAGCDIDVVEADLRTWVTDKHFDVILVSAACTVSPGAINASTASSCCAGWRRAGTSS